MFSNIISTIRSVITISVFRDALFDSRVNPNVKSSVIVACFGLNDFFISFISNIPTLPKSSKSPFCTEVQEDKASIRPCWFSTACVQRTATAVIRPFNTFEIQYYCRCFLCSWRPDIRFKVDTQWWCALVFCWIHRCNARFNSTINVNKRNVTDCIL